jgi:hypothetical protein
LDQAVEQDEGAELAVDVAVLELLADGARGLGRPRGLDGDDLDKVGDAAQVVFVVGFGGERLDGDRDGRVGLLLQGRLLEEMLLVRRIVTLGIEVGRERERH